MKAPQVADEAVVTRRHRTGRAGVYLLIVQRTGKSGKLLEQRFYEAWKIFGKHKACRLFSLQRLGGPVAWREAVRHREKLEIEAAAVHQAKVQARADRARQHREAKAQAKALKRQQKALARRQAATARMARWRVGRPVPDRSDYARRYYQANRERLLAARAGKEGVR